MAVGGHGRLLVGWARRVKTGGGKAVAAFRVGAVGRSKAPLVEFAMRDCVLNAAAGEPIREHDWVVIPSLAALRTRHPAKLGRP